MPVPWSNMEVRLITADYFRMLSSELRGETYSKTEHRKALKLLLNNRSEGSIEFKHQNISAILIELGLVYIKGYLPRYNYQQILKDAVIAHLKKDSRIEDAFQSFTDKIILLEQVEINFNQFVVDPPKENLVAEPRGSYARSPINVNYLEREQRNSQLGMLGEELVLKYEKWNLMLAGKEKLSEQVRWVSKEEGDGLGFDILSRNLNGTDKYIEVKTTKLGKETPIFLSKNELDFSIENASNFYLYRLFNFEECPRMFSKKGAFNHICRVEPINFRGYF